MILFAFLFRVGTLPLPIIPIFPVLNTLPEPEELSQYLGRELTLKVLQLNPHLLSESLSQTLWFQLAHVQWWEPLHLPRQPISSWDTSYISVCPGLSIWCWGHREPISAPYSPSKNWGQSPHSLPTPGSLGHSPWFSVSLPPGCSASTANMSISILSQKAKKWTQARRNAQRGVHWDCAPPYSGLVGFKASFFNSSYIPQFILKLNLFFPDISFFFKLLYNVVLGSSVYHAYMHSLPLESPPLTPHPFYPVGHHETMSWAIQQPPISCLLYTW